MWHSPRTAPTSTRPSARRPTSTTTAALLAALTVTFLTSATRLRDAVDRRVDDPERGDVPGWVMVTLMTAGLVAVVWVLADDWIRQLFQQAVDRVSGP
ncbi:hypothetical protein [Serinibacter arcticus]|uniref:hypothetical protein n=1 Tax=Serinibacter arcticus TaxID=1655435 RepID=UPI0011B294CF|nr:hypothetical protein [Serinibacter arcticus]